MNIKIYFLMFIFYSIFGWLFEEMATYDRSKGFINRGFLLGPYCPIYGYAAIFMMMLPIKTNNVLILFVLSLIICTLIEYLASFFMEVLFNARWWDYSKKPLNINGRVCLRNSLCFGLMGLLFLKYLNPFVKNMFLKITPNAINIIFYIVLLLFLIDNYVSFRLIYKIKKDNVFQKKDNTREIVQKGKEIIKNSIFGKKFIILLPQKIKKGKEKIKNSTKKIIEKGKNMNKRRKNKK